MKFVKIALMIMATLIAVPIYFVGGVAFGGFVFGASSGCLAMNLRAAFWALWGRLFISSLSRQSFGSVSKNLIESKGFQMMDLLFWLLMIVGSFIVAAIAVWIGRQI